MTDNCSECGEEIDLDDGDDRVCDNCAKEICIHCSQDVGGLCLCSGCAADEIAFREIILAKAKRS
jgi:hypothetical protein